MEANKRRPFKVCNSQRTTSKGLVAENLAELKVKGCEKLGIHHSPSCRVFLESDGTEIEDEDYFGFLGEQTKLMLVDAGDEWTPRDEELSINTRSGSYSASLETNESFVDSTDAPEAITMSLAHRMRKDPMFFISFSDDDLDTIIKCNTNELADALRQQATEASYSQETCQRELDRRLEMKQATELLRLYDRAAKQNYNDSQEPGIKRPRT